MNSNGYLQYVALTVSTPRDIGERGTLQTESERTPPQTTPESKTPSAVSTVRQRVCCQSFSAPHMPCSVPHWCVTRGSSLPRHCCRWL